MDQQRPVGGQDPASQAIADVLAGRISRRSFIRRATVLGLSGGTIAAVIAACGGGTASDSSAPAATAARTTAPATAAPTAAATPEPAPAFDPMRYAGEKVRIALVDGERDDSGLKDKKAEIKDTMGIDVEVTTLAARRPVAANDQNLRAPESRLRHPARARLLGRRAPSGAGLFRSITD